MGWSTEIGKEVDYLRWWFMLKVSTINCVAMHGVEWVVADSVSHTCLYACKLNGRKNRKEVL
jgi:hypothetical protein